VHQYSCSAISGLIQKISSFPKCHINNSLKTSLAYRTLFCLSVLSLDLVEKNFMELAKRHFANFHNLNRAAKVRYHL